MPHSKLKPIYFLKNDLGGNSFKIGEIDTDHCQRTHHLALVGEIRLSDGTLVNLQKDTKPFIPFVNINFQGKATKLDVGRQIDQYFDEMQKTELKDHITFGPFKDTFQDILVSVHFQTEPISAADPANPPYAVLYPNED